MGNAAEHAGAIIFAAKNKIVRGIFFLVVKSIALNKISWKIPNSIRYDCGAGYHLGCSLGLIDANLHVCGETDIEILYEQSSLLVSIAGSLL